MSRRGAGCPKTQNVCVARFGKDQYFASCYFLLAYVRDSRIHIDDIQIASLDIFSKAEKLARRYSLDLSDSLQLVSVKHGKFKSFVEESKTVLITADRSLAVAAQKEGVRVWNCEGGGSATAEMRPNHAMQLTPGHRTAHFSHD